MKASVRVLIVVFALVWSAVWILLPVDPPPPPHWQHEFDTPPDVVDGLTICVTGSLVEPSGLCTSEGIDPE